MARSSLAAPARQERPSLAPVAGRSFDYRCPRDIFDLGWYGLIAKRTEHEPNSDRLKVVIKLVDPEFETCERDAEEIP